MYSATRRVPSTPNVETNSCAILATVSIVIQFYFQKFMKNKEDFDCV